MRAKHVQPLEKPGILVKAMTSYKAGVEAEKRVLKYLPFVSTDVSRKLAKVRLGVVCQAKAGGGWLRCLSYWLS